MTFSTFSLETMCPIKEEKTLYSLFYVSTSLFTSIAAVFWGIRYLNLKIKASYSDLLS